MTYKFAFGFAAGISVAVLAACAWVEWSSTTQSAGYFVRIPELKGLSSRERSGRLLVTGRIREGSIVRHGSTTTFVLAEHNGPDPGGQPTVVYKGSDLPDTFQEQAQALAHGTLGGDGVFHADKVQAKWG
jgi:cytochrome c-type biogenesis protein CcmE